MKNQKAKKQPVVTKKPIGSEVLVNVILDRSGSMEDNRAGTISGYNEYLKGLRADGKTTYHVSLTQFDAPGNAPELTVSYVDKPLAEVPDLDASTYQPRGMTPLYDAIGETMRRLDGKTNGRPVLNVIITDGLENASQEFTRDGIKALIKEKEAQGHTFVFLGANIDSYAVGGNMGIAAKNISNYAPGLEKVAFAAVATSARSYSSTRAATGTLCQAKTEAFLDDEARAKLMGAGTIPTVTGTGGPAATSAGVPFRKLHGRTWTVSQ